MLLDDKSDYEESLHNKELVLKLTHLADIFPNLNELNLYLQETEGADMFAAHDKIQNFIKKKKLVLWKNTKTASMTVSKHLKPLSPKMRWHQLMP